MTFFNKIFGNKESSGTRYSDFWNLLESQEDLDYLIKKSFEKKVIIFKHSTRCFISKTVLKNFEKEIQDLHPNDEFYLLDLLAYRNLSNDIAERFGVQHQSPQLIVIENGKAIRSVSHQSINKDVIHG